MCTVTFFNTKEGFILTSNRDEQPKRSAIILEEKNINQQKFFFPKDEKAGGTWCAVSEKGNAVILLNGAFTKHEKNKNYRKSRGLIVLEILEKNNIISAIEELDLYLIEPFTLIIFFNKNLVEFRWNGEEKFFRELDFSEKHIWSSSTLYNTAAKEKRETWFTDFFLDKETNAENILAFHQNKTNDTENGIMMNRNNLVKTISTTQIIISEEIYIKHWEYENQVTLEKNTKLQHEF
ncbi:MAG: NRDE family protein [Cloacibacterium sp.]|jgi:hypothetical protein